jgi:hypothetical protein
MTSNPNSLWIVRINNPMGMIKMTGKRSKTESKKIMSKKEKNFCNKSNPNNMSKKASPSS